MCSSSLGPTNPAVSQVVEARIQTLHKPDPGSRETIPFDLITSSGSGLDPHIGVAAELYQAPRVARERKMSEGPRAHRSIQSGEHSVFWASRAYTCSS